MNLLRVPNHDERLEILRLAAIKRLSLPFQITCNNICYIFTIDDLEKHACTALATKEIVDYIIQKNVFVDNSCDDMCVFSGKYKLVTNDDPYKQKQIVVDGCPSLVDELAKRLLHFKISWFNADSDTCRLCIEIDDCVKDRDFKRQRMA